MNTTNQPVTGRTITSNAEVAGRFAAEKRAEGFKVEMRTHGSDSRRGTQVSFEIIWRK